MMDTSAPDSLSLSVTQSDDEDDGCMSGQSSTFGDSSDFMAGAMGDEVTAQLAAAGPVGMAAAAAILSAKKRKRPHSFETNPSIRKRQQNRLLRKLRQTIDEFATRVGQQAVVLVATPGKPTNSFRCFGAKPLEDVVKNLRSMIMDELESALAQQAPPPQQEDPSLYELPPLIIDGIPTPVEKMTQAQLRAFIPLMLKYSTGRGKPGWGRESTRPPWWPKDLPWANVRMDARPEEEKQKCRNLQISWTHALRQIVINCYKYHGREDLLPAFTDEEDKSGTVTTHYAPAILTPINNPDGTVSLIQVDPNNPIITLPDGTQAQVQNLSGSTMHAVQSLSEMSEGNVVDLNNVTEATLNQEGQLILTGEDGQAFPVTVSMVPVSGTGGVYQTVLSNIQHIQTSDGTIQVVTPITHHVPKVEPAAGSQEGVETITQQLVNISGEPQVLQVLSLKDTAALTKALQAQQSRDIVKEEGVTITGDH